MPPKKAFQKNMLVPFNGPSAERVAAIAELNHMPATAVVRMIFERGMETIEKEGMIKLRFPGEKVDA